MAFFMTFRSHRRLSINWEIDWTNLFGSLELFATNSQISLEGHLVLPSKFLHDSPGFF
jgi:hypothetical protein